MHSMNTGSGSLNVDQFASISHFVEEDGKWCAVFTDDSDTMLTRPPSLAFPEEFEVLRLMLADDVGPAMLHREAFDRLERARIILNPPTGGRLLSDRGRRLAESMA